MSTQIQKLVKSPSLRLGLGAFLVLSFGLGLWFLHPTASRFDYSALKCQAAEKSESAPALTAQQLTDILLIPERTKVSSIAGIFPPPLCTLPDLEMRPGAQLKRTVYKLAFNEHAVLVVGTEGDEYLGYRIRGLKEGAVTVITDRNLNLFQNWHVKIGDQINGVQVIGSLGQVTLKLDGKNVVAPFDGHGALVGAGCIRFDGIDVPGYVIQLCGLDNPQAALVNKGKPIGTGKTLLLGVLRRQANGAWAFVEPSNAVIKSIIN